MATGSEGSESASMMARMEDVAPPSNVELEDPAKLMTLTLWIALTKAQFDDLVNGKPQLSQTNIQIVSGLGAPCLRPWKEPTCS